MISLLLRLFIVVFILWLLRVVLARVFRTSARQNESDKESALASNNMVKDPICGMYMDSRLAIRLEKRKETLFFCSEECKSKYLGNPTEGTGAQTPPTA
jgi:uncharacterized protein